MLVVHFHTRQCIQRQTSSYSPIRVCERGEDGVWIWCCAICQATTTGALKVLEEVFTSFIMFRTIVGHEVSKFANSEGDVRSGTVGQVHTFSN